MKNKKQNRSESSWNSFFWVMIIVIISGLAGYGYDQVSLASAGVGYFFSAITGIAIWFLFSNVIFDAN